MESFSKLFSEVFSAVKVFSEMFSAVFRWVFSLFISLKGRGGVKVLHSCVAMSLGQVS